jgi:hypothetical protein
MRAGTAHCCFGTLMTNRTLSSGAPKKEAALETISAYYRRRADQERQCADRAVDLDLRRIHLDRAACMQRLAESACGK